MIETYATRHAIDALRRAQMYWPTEADEPLVDSEKYVRIREVCRALEQLRGNATGDDVDFEAYGIVWNALRTGALVARVIETNTLIPQVAWPQILPTAHHDDPETTPGEAVWRSNLWYSTLPKYDFVDDLLETPVGGLRPFASKLPLIDFSEAVKWVVLSTPRSRAKVAQSFSTTKETEQAFSAWIHENPNSTDAQRNQWYRDHGLNRERGRELWRKLKPLDGSKAGPKPKS
ncbi:hypothetical protein [Ruegeria sp. HKCCA0370]|uniref:hypothetical protein n=1 Tax=Ruegeria sp. HKCCA0370 TaxID=2682995 RepID=UPI0014892522|nr:hypothetical protein [Ruegeria sp. HKCCA0370]